MPLAVVELRAAHTDQVQQTYEDNLCIFSVTRIMMLLVLKYTHSLTYNSDDT